MVTLVVLAFLVLALLAYLVGIYNGLVRVGASVKLAWSNIDVLLVQRHDELPKLVEVCRQYMEYERDTLTSRRMRRFGNCRHESVGWRRPLPIGARSTTIR